MKDAEDKLIEEMLSATSTIFAPEEPMTQTIVTHADIDKFFNDCVGSKLEKAKEKKKSDS